MAAISLRLQTRFKDPLRNRQVQNNLRGAHKEWLRYYLDYFKKYDFPGISNESFPNAITRDAITCFAGGQKPLCKSPSAGR